MRKSCIALLGVVGAACIAATAGASSETASSPRSCLTPPVAFRGVSYRPVFLQQTRLRLGRTLALRREAVCNDTPPPCVVGQPCPPRPAPTFQTFKLTRIRGVAPRRALGRLPDLIYVADDRCVGITNERRLIRCVRRPPRR